MGIETAIGVGGSILGGVIGANGAKSAANAQAKASKKAIEEQRRQYEQSRTDLAPWRTEGGNALARLGRASTGNMADFYVSPDYNFTRTEGMRGIERSAAARGGAFSGNALRGLTDYTTGLASGEFGNWWNRQAGLAQGGLGAAQATTNAGANAANSISQSMQAAGDARASGILGGQNALAGGINNGFNFLADYLGSRNSGLQRGFGGTYYNYSGQGPGPWALS